jgi:hypothetical protein
VAARPRLGALLVVVVVRAGGGEWQLTGMTLLVCRCRPQRQRWLSLLLREQVEEASSCGLGSGLPEPRAERQRRSWAKGGRAAV